MDDLKSEFSPRLTRVSSTRADEEINIGVNANANFIKEDVELTACTTANDGELQLQEVVEDEATMQIDANTVLINNRDTEDERCSSMERLSINALAITNNMDSHISDAVVKQNLMHFVPVPFLSESSDTDLSELEPKVDTTSHERATVGSDEEETLFNNNVCISTNSIDNVTECKDKTDYPNILNEKQNVGGKESEKFLESSMEPKKTSNHSTVRPTLADDGRLVKMSLPTNPINLMQSNAQFLNKSRNFLNFITEKSANIMEKALLPQHLVIKQNSTVHTLMPWSVVEFSVPDMSPRVSDLPNKTKNITDLRGFSTERKNENFYPPQSSIPEFMNVKQDEKQLGSVNDEDAILQDDANREVSTREKVNKTNSVHDPNAETNDNTGESHKYKERANLMAKNIKITEKLEEANLRLEAERCGQAFTEQIQNLEKTVDRLTFELRSSLTSQEAYKKEYIAANKERENMVMKYAVGEKQLIDTQKARDNAECKIKEITREHELLQNKLRQSQGERTRICNILDGKCKELADLQREVERLREDLKMRDVKLKWTQTKLKTEMDVQKETQQKLDKAVARINEMRDECEQVRRESQESIRKFQQSEENKAVTLDQQLKEQQARLILERHVMEDKEMLCLRLQKEVDAMKNTQQALIEENNSLSLKVQDFERNKSTYDCDLNTLRTIAEQRERDVSDLLSKVTELENLKLRLQEKNDSLTPMETEVKLLRSVNEELRCDMEACRQREADMLEFTQKLTDKNVQLQSEFTAIEARAKRLEKEHGPLHEYISKLNEKIKCLEAKLTEEQKVRTEECEILAKHIAEQTQLAQNLAQKLEDSQGENAVLKRKQQISMKEMTRELQQCRKRLEAFEATSPCNSLDVTSRAGSNVSLNTGDTLNGALSDNSTNGEQNVNSGEPSKQALIDRILKLQKDHVRRAEKLDFLEEHTRTLVEELQKKTKIIQNYILHENFGAMGSNERDRHKLELAKHGGIMASVYNQRVSDENMTLELSLEINQKLQVGLEDALLKNITLKDNVDTLSKEVARLMMHGQQRRSAT
ncbi:hypothetical protein KM043_003218 [Ampulex compressa]|nr:hypothetical protein KM043_003218 [Ampulex compressa]